MDAFEYYFRAYFNIWPVYTRYNRALFFDLISVEASQAGAFH